MDWLLLIPLVFLAVSAWCAWMAYWHKKEADYWFVIGMEVLNAPNEEVVAYSRLLSWAHENQPSYWLKTFGWVPPHVRRRQWEIAQHNRT